MMPRPSESWAADHLWAKGIHTHNWILYLDQHKPPQWECDCERGKRYTVTETALNDIEEHLATEKHQQNVTLAKLALDERTQ